jgi:hypothetical protein
MSGGPADWPVVPGHGKGGTSAPLTADNVRNGRGGGTGKGKKRNRKHRKKKQENIIARLFNIGTNKERVCKHVVLIIKG